MQQPPTSTSPEIPKEIVQFLAELDELVTNCNSNCTTEQCEQIRQFVEERAAALPYKDIIPEPCAKGYGRLQLGIGDKSGLELVLVQIPKSGKIQCHTHCGWAVVKVLEGIEVNRFFKRVLGAWQPTGDSATYKKGDVAILEDSSIAHEITAPECSISLHVYYEPQDKLCGADFIE